jgi:phage tail protein X
MSSHFQSAHFASVHFLSYHFSGGTAQIIEAVLPPDPGADDGDLIRLPNGAIIAIAIGALLILEDDLDY